MDSVKRRVYLDLFASPLNLIPFAVGVSSLMASWAVGGEPTLTVFGLLGVLGAAGITASRIILGLEGMTERAYDYQLALERQRREAELDALHLKLTQDEDPRTEACLHELRTLYNSLRVEAEKGKITTAAYEILNGLDQVLSQCVRQLEHSHRMWETSRKLRGPARGTLEKQRDQVVREVCETVMEVGRKIDDYLQSETQRNRSELSRVRKELGESIEAARRAEARVSEMERSASADFSEPDDPRNPNTK